MQIQQKNWTSQSGWQHISGPNGDTDVSNSLVFVFGDRFELEQAERFKELQALYPNSDIIINSTSGEIIGQRVSESSIAATAVKFEKTAYHISKINISEVANSYAAGKALAASFNKENLRHVFVVSDGQLVNGSELAKGFNETLPENVASTGGLAGDGPRFEKTLVGYNNAPSEGNIIAVGFYGDALKIGYGSVGGWDSFGPERVVTKSEGNVLHELDGKSALELYKRYLGPKAEGLPGAALLFPLSMKIKDDDQALVRTILSIDEETQTMTFAGDIPIGARVRLMKANFDKLIDGAYDAASESNLALDGNKAELALLVSCVGRRLVLDQRIEEEVEGVCEVIGDKPAVTGFYSYGELAPFAGLMTCELHNQTMTITLLGEK